MKQITIVIGIAATILLVTLSLISIENKYIRGDELNKAVASAVKQTVQISQIDNQKEIRNNDEMVAEFVNILCSDMTSDTDLQIDVMGVDYKEGLLDVKVTGSFTYLNGKKENIIVRKTAIYD